MAEGALLVYDVTIFETFEKLKNWVNTLHEAVGKDIPFVIAGNKFDLLDKNDINKNAQQVDAYINEVNCKHFYTSAKTGYNLEEAFDCLIKTVLQKIEKTNDNLKIKRGGKKSMMLVDQKREIKEKKRSC